eukprot:COSAG06_NODE_72_length_25897_cov_9.227382_25_plen_194_part_01
MWLAQAWRKRRNRATVSRARGGVGVGGVVSGIRPAQPCAPAPLASYGGRPEFLARPWGRRGARRCADTLRVRLATYFQVAWLVFGLYRVRKRAGLPARLGPTCRLAAIDPCLTPLARGRHACCSYIAAPRPSDPKVRCLSRTFRLLGWFSYRTARDATLHPRPRCSQVPLCPDSTTASAEKRHRRRAGSAHRAG